MVLNGGVFSGIRGGIVFDEFRRGVCCTIVLIIQVVLTTVTANAAAETLGAAAKSPSYDANTPDSAAENIPPSASDGLPASLPPQADGFRRIADVFIVPGKQNLAELIGMSEISVLADVDGQYVKNMAENQIMGEDFASQVDETNILESIRAGRSFNRESLAALARTAQAKAQTEQALALLLPSVSVSVSHGEETSEPSVVVDEATGELSQSDTHLRTDAALIVRQPLFNLPVFLDWRRRKVKEQARGENYRVSDGDAYISTVNAYLSLVSTRLQTDITRDFEKQLAELLSYIQKRAGAGAASISDMSRVLARSQETLSSRLEQESAHAAAGIEFVRLTNLVPQMVRLPVLDDVGASALPKSFEMAFATALQTNPEIAALTAELQAEKIEQAVAKGRYLPRVDAEYTDSYSQHAGGAPSSAGQRDMRAMIVLNWNLFSGGKDYKYHVERAARYKELQYLLDDQRRLVVKELSANYAALATTGERIASGYQELKSISIAAEAMSKRMLSGNQSLLDLLDVYDRFYRVRSRLVSLHVLEMNTLVKLVRLTLGTPWAVPDDASAAAGQKRVSPLLNDQFWDDDA
jgi:adhesin transport system outer membrane protein